MQNDDVVIARQLIDRLANLPLRTLDALHLAIAERINAEALASADKVNVGSYRLFRNTCSFFCSIKTDLAVTHPAQSQEIQTPVRLPARNAVTLTSPSLMHGLSMCLGQSASWVTRLSTLLAWYAQCLV